MNFDIPEKLQSYLDELDRFIEQEIKPLEEANDNIRFFDHRREDARTDWERNGLPNEDCEALLAQAKRVADAAGHYRYPLPEEYGGSNGTNLDMAGSPNNALSRRSSLAKLGAAKACSRCTMSRELAATRAVSVGLDGQRRNVLLKRVLGLLLRISTPKKVKRQLRRCLQVVRRLNLLR